MTIDPQGTRDFDDALSIIEHPNETYTVSVYIANVTACLDAYGLWGHVDLVIQRLRYLAIMYMKTRNYWQNENT